MLLDTDSNKPTDFFLNPICIMHTTYKFFITFLMYLYCTNEIKV